MSASASGSSESPEPKVKIEKSSSDIKNINSRYALYLFSNNKHAASPETMGSEKNNKNDPKSDEEPSVCLSLLEGNLNAEQETVVRCFLLKTLSAREDLSFENEGKYAALQFSSENPELFGCYYHRLSKTTEDEENSKLSTFFICLIGPANGIMESFCPELGKFCYSLIPLLDPEGLKDKDCMQNKLKSWNVHCIEYIERCIKLFGEDLSLVFLCALWGNVNVIAKDEQIKWDVEQFVDTCCLMPKDLQSKKDSVLISETDVAPTITVEDNKISINISSDYSMYCKKWFEKLKNCGQGDFLGMHNVLEAFRLKTVQDLNVLKRLVQKSQMDHYALYRAFLFLRASGYDDILLYHVQKEASMAGENDVLDVISCLRDFLKEEENLPERRLAEKS
ncbi:hypothetical protein JTE90_024117 [Oedothorax gibbosus]|uniref:Protein Njmu-R1 n=1 Tax=Oedothorax gibbosus TaxID=931172 RepID=A0AAV6URX4_9ARAC|nr:hypothetical protein JTE90_024117 [Oedothorax gibbosus]